MSNEQFTDFSLLLEDNIGPTARALPKEQQVVVGSIVKLDGRSSSDPSGSDLVYFWTFSQIPIGSQVNLFGFTLFEDDSSIVGFAPDITGTYKIQLVVSDGSITSDPDEVIIDVRVILVPHHQGFIPDASFIWNYLSDFWSLVPDKKRFETFWSAAIQVTASEMLKLYQYQYNKSIRDIQDLIQKRWLAFSPALALDKDTISFILSDDTAGSQASTFVLDPISGLAIDGQPSYSDTILIPLSEGNFTETPFGAKAAVGKILRLANRSYTLDRTNLVFKSLNFGIDGSSSGSVTLTGSQFTIDMVGATLRIIGPSASTLLGDYIIASYISPTTITIDPSHLGVTWAGQTDLIYTVIPRTPLDTAFFADRLQVPAGLEQQYWRLGSTLISSTINFENEGVSIGDTIQIEITRTDILVISIFYAQIISVDRNRVGFVLSLNDLIDGVAAKGLSEDIQITLASDLIVPGLTAKIDGTLDYTLIAADIKSIITSVAFKRLYFEKELSPIDEINIGPFSIFARPVQIIRNRKIAIDPIIASIPILQEYIKQPTIVEDQNKIFFITDFTKTEVSRKPYLLSENLDYILDDESTITGICSIQVNNDELVIPRGDLIDRSVQEGDIIEISIGVTTEKFDIRKIISADIIRVFPVPTLSSTGAFFTITRRLPGKFIRFIDGVFTKSSPAPFRLWAEVSYLDNGESVENNFGILVGLRRDDLKKVGSGIPYKSAVAGLMFALSNGPTISNLDLSAQILLGLPFAQNSGIIKEINPGFRKRDDGSPLFGRILIDGIDRNGNSLGITNIYFYPEGRQLFDAQSSSFIPAVPNFSGLGINPDTGVIYKVGDVVPQFAPLSKGVEIQEYLTTPTQLDNLIAQGNSASVLQKYHSFQVLVNSDLVTSADIDIVAQFMKKVKAHYIRLTSGLLKSLEDTIDIEDSLGFSRALSFFDNSDLGTPTAAKLDRDDSNDAYLSINGLFYTKYLSGSNLVTTKDSTIVTSASGGFISARISHIESWDPPLLRRGDLLVIKAGNNSGSYEVVAINSDTSATLNLTDISLETSINFETSANQLFTFYRPLINPIWIGKINLTLGNATVPVLELNSSPGGIRAAGVAVGDILVFANLGTLNPVVSKRYTITETNPGSSPTLSISPVPSESSAQYTAWVTRERLIPKGIISPSGSAGERFYVSTTVAGDFINFIDTGLNINSWLNLSMLRPGDTITISSIPYTVMRYEPVNRRALVTPPLLTNETNKEVFITLRPERSITTVSIDFLDRMPGDYLQLELHASVSVGDLANTTNTSKDVTLTVETPATISAIPGDLLTILAGTDSLRDVGFGAGVFPIHKIVGTTIHLMDALTVTGTFKYGLRRRVSNEG